MSNAADRCGLRSRSFRLLCWCLVLAGLLGIWHPCSGEEAEHLSREEIARLAERYRPISRVEFPDSDIRNVCKVISDTTGLSIFVGPEVKQRVGVWARDINPIDLLDRAVAAAGATYVIQGSTVSIMTWKEYQERMGLAKEVVDVQYLDATRVASAVQAFLTDRGKVFADAERNAVVILETPAALEAILEMVRALDVETAGPVLKVIALDHARAEVLAPKVLEAFKVPERTAERRFGGAEPAGGLREFGEPEPTGELAAPRGEVLVYADERTNSLVIKGMAADVTAAEELIAQLDVADPTVVRSYPILHLQAAEVFANLRDFLKVDERQDKLKGGPVVSLSEQTNSVIVSATEIEHARVREFLEQTDVPIPEMASTMRVYRLENVGPDRVAAVVTELLEDQERKVVTDLDTEGKPTPEEAEEARPIEEGERPVDILAEQPAVSVVAEANAVVIRATARQHEELKALIEQIDQPRHQVMIEAIIVQLLAEDDFMLGVELESAHLGDGVDTGHMFFSAFGLSTLDPATGERVPRVTDGLTAAIVKPDYVPFILKALETAANARITSAPRILVNDNAQGVIDSLQRQPYTTAVLGETTTTTTFGGYVDAGTRFIVSPHISEGNSVRLEYQLELSTFTDDPLQEGIPPPTATDTVASEAVVPDGHTIIVGGLRGTVDRRAVNRIPLLGHIPFLGVLFRSKSHDRANTTTFVFLRPLIVRGGQFEALKHLSTGEREEAEVEGGHPKSDVKLMGVPG